MRGLESIDMLIALGLVALFMLGVYVLSYYFADVSKQTEAAAASKLDAQEILKKILQSPGDPSGWSDMNQVNSLGLADPELPGMLDPKKLMALAVAGGVNAESSCTVSAAHGDYPVTKVGYGIYVWGAPTPTSLDPSVYERILRSLFGDGWSKYDIELRIRPALKVAVTPAGSQVFVRVDPPGVYDINVCYVAWPGNTPANPEPPGVYIRGAYVWTQGGYYYARVDVENTGSPAVVTNVQVGNVVIFSGSQPLGSYCKTSFAWPTLGTSNYNPCDFATCYAQVTFTNATGTYTAQAPVTFVKPLGAFQGCYAPDVTTPISACASGQTGEDGRGSASVSGLSLFAYAYVRGVMLKGVNYTYAGSGTVSLIGLVAKPDAGVYVVHSRFIQDAGGGGFLCGCDDPGVSAVGLRYLGVFLGGQSAPLYNDLTVNPGVSLDLNNVCVGGEDVGGCLIPWNRFGRAKFLIAAVSRDSLGQPPHCGGVPQNDVIVMPLAGGLPPLYEVHFATWRRWVSSRPEALAASHASAVADAGEITYVVDLWVFRYP
ncbi:MAG: hypothetical protein ACO2PM_24525 [Pyrobaculum sp.]